MSGGMTYYKVLAENGAPHHGGSGTWSLPEDGPGDWMPAISPVVPCESGYHLCQPEDLIEWLGPVIYEAEGRGESVRHEHKTVFAEARLIRRAETWNESTARLFACDCADRALALIENPDPRSVNAVAVARGFALGDKAREEMAAARAAAWAAAGDAARAAEDAVWAAVGAAADAAGAAARAAAWAAAWAAARAAAAAAGDAARAAARAAEAAAGAAAGAAEREWQAARLLEYLAAGIEAR